MKAKISQIVSLLLAGSFFALAPLTFAEPMLRMQADVPFEFQLGGKTLPAGRYSVEIDRSSHSVIFRSATEYAYVNVSAGSAYREAGDATNGRLAFEDYGTAHVLKKLWLNGEWKGYVIPATRTGRELAKQASTKRVATEIAAQ